jgi:hypothetical protein
MCVLFAVLLQQCSSIVPFSEPTRLSAESQFLFEIAKFSRFANIK